MCGGGGAPSRAHDKFRSREEAFAEDASHGTGADNDGQSSNWGSMWDREQGVMNTETTRKATEKNKKHLQNQKKSTDRNSRYKEAYNTMYGSNSYTSNNQLGSANNKLGS